MLPTTTPQPEVPSPTDIWLRIQVTYRRLRFAALLSRLTGQTLDRAWLAFRPLPGPDGPWGAPTSAGAGTR